MKKTVIGAMLGVAVLVLGAVFVGNSQSFANGNRDHSGDNIVGVWEVDAAAPYRPHLFTFHEDGTMTTTNPTNVQENPASPHGGTNDSLGMGVWKVVKQGNTRYIVGTFEQLNAFADNHQPTDKLSVSFKVRLTNGDNGFDGPASAKVGADTQASHLTGTRVTIDANAVHDL